MGKRYKVRTGEGTPEFEYDTKIYFKFKGVDLTNGTTFYMEGVDDLKNNVIIIKCRNCNVEHSWDKKSSTEDEWTSGLCKNCLLIEEQKSNRKEFEYVRRIKVMNNEIGQWINPPKDKEWEVKYQDGTIKKGAMEDIIPLFCYTEEELREGYSNLKYKILDEWKLIKFEESHIENFEINLIDNDSIFFKIIKNRDLDDDLQRMIMYEKWKVKNFELFIRLLSECSDKSNEQVLEFLNNDYLKTKTPGGSSWTIQAVRYLREYIDQIPKDISKDWEKWENTIRVMLQISKVLIPERILVFKNDTLKQFSYKEIDALIKLDDDYFLIEAKYKGGDVNPKQVQVYIKTLEKIGYKITATFFITAEDGITKKLADNIYVLPSMWFSAIYDGKQEEKVLLRIKRAIAIAEGKFP